MNKEQIDFYNLLPARIPSEWLQLTAGMPMMVIESGVVFVTSNSAVEIQCSGSGNPAWEFSSGVGIPESNNALQSLNVHQTHNPVSKIHILFIRAFTPADMAFYTCRTDLMNGYSLMESVYISSSKLTMLITIMVLDT
jgi:hypothetical protein